MLTFFTFLGRMRSKEIINGIFKQTRWGSPIRDFGDDTSNNKK